MLKKLIMLGEICVNPTFTMQMIPQGFSILWAVYEEFGSC